MTTTTTKLAAALLAGLMAMTGCLGLFGDEATTETNTTSIEDTVGNDTAEQIQERTAGQFKNYTIGDQRDLPGKVLWFNGSIGPDQTVASQEDRNDRSGTNYNTRIVANDISSDLPVGQPAEISIKLFYLPGPGQSADLDIFVDVPGLQTDFAGDDCDEFSWKVCVQERIVNTVGKSDEDAQVGVQIANNRALQGMDYALRVDVTYAKDVVAPSTPYAFEVPENATGVVVSSVKAGGGEHIRGELLLIGPDDELVDFVTYDDIAIPTESKLIPVDEAGEYIIYPVELKGGFLEVSADIPVPSEQRNGRMLSTSAEPVADATSPTPGVGHTCAPNVATGGCTNVSRQAGGSTTFTAEGTFPLEVTAWINQPRGEEVGGPNANLDAEVRILNADGELVSRAKKLVQYEDDRGTIGSSRDELNYEDHWENLAKGEYTVQYVVDGTATVGHTVKTYSR